METIKISVKGELMKTLLGAKKVWLNNESQKENNPFVLIMWLQTWSINHMKGMISTW